MIDVKLVVDMKSFESELKAAAKEATMEIKTNVGTELKAITRKVANKILPEAVASFAPSPEEEAQILSGQSYPVDRSRRFIKTNMFIPVKDALLRYSRFGARTDNSIDGYDVNISLTPQSEDLIRLSIGFAWVKQTGKKSLERRSTIDPPYYQSHWKNLLDKWEDGGSYTVLPRKDGDLLSPADNVTRKRMYKTIKPFRMFDRGLSKGADKIADLISLTIQQKYGGKI